MLNICLGLLIVLLFIPLSWEFKKRGHSSNTSFGKQRRQIIFP